MADDYRNEDGLLENGEAAVHPLSEDNDTPFSLPTDHIDDPTLSIESRGKDSVDPTSPLTDSDLDPHELYDEGLAGAAEAHTPSAGDSIIGYTPPNTSK
ncbi:MAG: hypothetical protein QFB86_01700 [Patescibacteria group bacterium]|nr:hypothetical protein [Patescibacteria group bacterium]